MRVGIIIPAFNEEQALPSVLSVIPKKLPGISELRTVVVNDGSEDATESVAKQHGAIVLNHYINRGQGAALQTGFTYALVHDLDAVVTFDADGQHSAEEIRDILRPIIDEQYDVALGCRFLEKQPSNLSLARRLTLKGGVVFTRVVSRVRVKDTHNGFRAFHRRAFESIQLIHDKMEHASEILDQIGQKNLRFCEVPVTIQYTDYSVAKGQRTGDAIKIALKILLSKITQ